jgi:hypothetical protein
LFNVIAELLSKGLCRHASPCKSDNGEMIGEKLLGGKIAESGKQFAARQIAGSAKDDHDARISFADGSGIRFRKCRA